VMRIDRQSLARGVVAIATSCNASAIGNIS
jgi:hypothetical protein